MNQLPDLVQKILERLVDFFDIFDLSFFVSGAMVLAGSLYLLQFVSSTWTGFPVPEWGTGFTFGAVVLACYLLGMIAFATGRWLRGTWALRSLKTQSTGKLVWAAVKRHQLLGAEVYSVYRGQLPQGEEVSEAEVANGGAFYTRLWAELRQSDVLKPSYILIRRYWVMSATYDGLAVALIFWMFLALITAVPTFDGAYDIRLGFLCLSLLGLFFFLAYACFREANRYQRYQVEEIVATLAYKHQVAGLDKD